MTDDLTWYNIWYSTCLILAVLSSYKITTFHVREKGMAKSTADSDQDLGKFNY